MTFPKVRLVARVLTLVLLGVLAVGWRYGSLKYGWCFTHPRVQDQVGVMERSEVCRIDGFLGAFNSEMSADIRILVVPNTGGQPIERFSLEHARKIGLGQETDRHGLLLVYDVEGHQMRVEVGSNFEGVFTDGFVGFLIREHLRSFASTNRMAIGVRATLMMVFTRIRQAVLGEAYDPRVVQFIEDRRRLVVGGGTTAGAISNDTARAFTNREGNREELAYFSAQPTVEEAYSRFLDWLAIGAAPSDASLFTGASQEWLRDTPITNAYGEFMILLMHGKSYRIVEKGNLALLYYTNTPFAPPMYFRKWARGWQVDVIGEVLNTGNLVGYPYTWTTQYSGDDFSQRFAYLWQIIGRVGRISGGDNRPLPIRSFPWQERVLSLVKGDPWKELPVRSAPPIDTMSLASLTDEMLRLRGHPALVVFYYTDQDFQRTWFPALVEMQRTYPDARVVAYSIDPVENVHWVPRLFERYRTDLAPHWLHPYDEAAMVDLFRSLGVDSASAASCSCSRALVFDSSGQLRFSDDNLTRLADTRAALAATQ